MSDLPDPVTRILAERHLSILATTDPDGQAQTSVIFVIEEGNDLVFSTIKGRRKTTNMQRDPRANLLLHGLESWTWVTVSGPVTLVDDPDGAFHQVMYDRYMDGAPTPPEPGAERVIVRLTPQRVYVQPAYDAGPVAVHGAS
jgi:PPOX class probable F420-dependent enzyme